MKFFSYLQEEYCARYDNVYGNDGSTEIFVNPSAKEIHSFKKHDIRFIADARTKKLFVWDGTVAIHDDIFHILLTSKDIKPVKSKYIGRDPNILTGIAKNDNGKLNFIDSNQIYGDIKDRDAAYVKKMMGFDWEWLRPYFTHLAFIIDMQRKLKMHTVLDEEYLSMSHKVETFVNPSLKELMSIRSRKIRFFINFEKEKIVVWDANEMLHYSMLVSNKELQGVLGIKNADEYGNSLPNIFSGYGSIRSGKIANVESDGITVFQDYEKDYKKMKTEWSTTWFEEPISKIILNLIKKIKR